MQKVIQVTGHTANDLECSFCESASARLIHANGKREMSFDIGVRHRDEMGSDMLMVVEIN